ncbi:gamma interferon inducible lysosomal thiol reductase [Grosmannia clavigera kw1407]|uniref:Gamma interferon inducible lysosomal thiol reductase n=1 Tax=Grosmannia clavigera (strain kw1407 / UAMH 11150) TaxID=655863 RepID=F0X8M9_GROCL|nr:gamma interferon inducible lysosomal thiol reductase [Grosmannia clavigera kw1407]EFX05227.1 gamma interferon inducible lysosomal thiol reductase [Grosmannia clavigera kw1407]
MEAGRLPLLAKHRQASPARRLGSSIWARITAIAAVSALVFWGLTQDGFFFHAAPMPPVSGSKLVPLEAHIMSKCPDARDCLHDLILPAMQQVYEKTNFTLSFIGQQAADGGVECKHGPAECMGNIIELCASRLYPDPKIYLGFTMCLFRDYQDIPEQSIVEDCALEHGIDIEAINECATLDDGEHGMDLLRRSIRHSKDAGVTYSCTVRLDEQVYCIRDDGQWKECPSGGGVNDLVLAVEKLWRQANE